MTDTHHFSSVPSDNPISEGEPLTIEQAIANLQGSDLGLRVYAAWWLGRFRVSEPDAIQALIQALDDTDDRTHAGGYPLRRNAARALGKLGDRRAVPPLIQCLQCSDYYVREAAAQALESLGDPSCIPDLIALLQAEPPAMAPGDPFPQPYDSILEALGTLGATDAIHLVQQFTDHEAERIRYAAIRAMYQLAPTPEESAHYGNQLIQALAHPNLQLRRTVLSDLGAIGYLHAAEPIAQTLAENSLKLIALRGVLETHLQTLPPQEVSEEAIAVMTLMDNLL